MSWSRIRPALRPEVKGSRGLAEAKWGGKSNGMASEAGIRNLAAEGTVLGLSPRRAALVLFGIGILHRALQIWLIWPALSRQIEFTIGVEVQTMLPEITMRSHPWWGLWYLQQTPPLSYMVGVVVAALFHNPYKIAVFCLMMQGTMASATAASMALLLVRLGIAARWAFLAAFIFLMAGGMITIEYHTMGQMWHDLMAMLLTVLACHVGVTISRRLTAGAAFDLGIYTGLLVLTRATFSFFAPFMAAWLILMGAWRKPMTLLAFIAPVLVMQGGWVLKNYIAFGYINTATSSWGGANLYHGEVVRHGSTEFHDWIANHKPLCPEPWYDLTVNMPPTSTIFYFLPSQWPEGKLPPGVVAKDAEVAARRGAVAGWDTLADALWSQCLMKEFSAYWLHRPALVAKEWWQSYQLFWHPIGQYAVRQPLTLQPDQTEYSFGLNLARSIRDAFREYHAHYLLLQRKITLDPITKADFVRVPMISLPVIPELIAALNFITVNSLPLLLLVRWAAGRKTPFPTGFWFLVLAFAYAAGFSCLGEFSENMRYRLEIEPVIWILSLLIAIEWVRLARGWWASRSAIGTAIPGSSPSFLHPHG
jgi:hypothetical protein